VLTVEVSFLMGGMPSSHPTNTVKAHMGVSTDNDNCHSRMTSVKAHMGVSTDNDNCHSGMTSIKAHMGVSTDNDNCHSRMTSESTYGCKYR